MNITRGRDMNIRERERERERISTRKWVGANDEVQVG